jgi:hypothetical protein
VAALPPSTDSKARQPKNAAPAKTAKASAMTATRLERLGEALPAGIADSVDSRRRRISEQSGGPFTESNVRNARSRSVIGIFLQ